METLSQPRTNRGYITQQVTALSPLQAIKPHLFPGFYSCCCCCLVFFPSEPWFSVLNIAVLGQMGWSFQQREVG